MKSFVQFNNVVDQDLNQSEHDKFQDENLPFEPKCGHIVYLTNFFLSSGLDKKKFSTNKISSLYFMAPERIIGGIDLKNEKEACKSDIWSLGVIVFFLVFGYLPFKGTSVSKLIKCIQKNKLTFEMKGVSPSVSLLLDLLSKMLVTSPEQRIDAANALNHKFITTSFPKKET